VSKPWAAAYKSSTKTVWILALQAKSFAGNDLVMVEPAGVELDISVENTQLTDP
jgi:hypothetical protein